MTESLTQGENAAPGGTPEATPRRALIVKAGGAARAVDLAQIDELLVAPVLTDLPFAPPWLRGVASLRGEAVPVVDLAVLEGADSAPVGEGSRLVVLKRQPDGGRLALLTPAVEGVREIVDAAGEKPAPPLAQPFLRRATRLSGDAVEQIDTSALVAALRHFLSVYTMALMAPSGPVKE